MSDYISRRCLICANINPCRAHCAHEQLEELRRNDAEISEIRARQRARKEPSQ